MSFVKWDDDKPPMFELSTYDRNVLEDEARVLALGAGRYGRHNWHQAAPQEGAERYTGALMRHLLAVLAGERIDPDSGLPHTAHIRVNAGFLGRFLRELEIDQELTNGMECPNDAEDRIPGKDDAHIRLHEAYYAGKRLEDLGLTTMRFCNYYPCAATLGGAMDYVGISGYQYCSKGCASDARDIEIPKPSFIPADSEGPES